MYPIFEQLAKVAGQGGVDREEAETFFLSTVVPVCDPFLLKKKLEIGTVRVNVKNLQ